MKTSLLQNALQATGAAPAQRVLGVAVAGAVTLFAALTYAILDTNLPWSLLAGAAETLVLAWAALRYTRYKREHAAAEAKLEAAK